MKKSQNYLLLFLAVIGLVVSIYLTWSKLAHQAVYCGNYGGCESVQNSPYSEIVGIPIALLGAGAYFFIILLILFENRIELLNKNNPLILFGVGLAGTIYSAYLTYIEIAILKEICIYCVISAVVITAIMIIAVVRLYREYF